MPASSLKYWLKERFDGNLAEMSRVTGIHRNQLNGYLTGKNSPSLEALERIAKALGVSVSYLLATEDERSALQLSTSLNAPQIPSWQSSLTAETLKRTIDERIDQRLEASRAPQTAQPTGAVAEFLVLAAELPEESVKTLLRTAKKMAERARAQKKRSDAG